jgi:hypothetical protein
MHIIMIHRKKKREMTNQVIREAYAKRVGEIS